MGWRCKGKKLTREKTYLLHCVCRGLHAEPRLLFSLWRQQIRRDTCSWARMTSAEGHLDQGRRLSVRQRRLWRKERQKWRDLGPESGRFHCWWVTSLIANTFFSFFSHTTMSWDKVNLSFLCMSLYIWWKIRGRRSLFSLKKIASHNFLQWLLICHHSDKSLGFFFFKLKSDYARFSGQTLIFLLPFVVGLEEFSTFLIPVFGCGCLWCWGHQTKKFHFG